MTFDTAERFVPPKLGTEAVLSKNVDGLFKLPMMLPIPSIGILIRIERVTFSSLILSSGIGDIAQSIDSTIVQWVTRRG